MPGERVTLDQTLRSLRILHSVFMLTMLMYMLVLHMIPHTVASIDPLTYWVMAVVGAGCYAASLFFRSRKIIPAIEALRVRPDDFAALASWRVGLIFSDLLMECVFLFGFALYFVGATVSQVTPFFSIAFATMLFFFPKRP